jgi:putative holliday junction resolvase
MEAGSVPPAGRRIMALDMGEKRIGVAISDETHLLARSYEVLPRTSRKADFARLADIARAEKVGFLVVGLPLAIDGEDGPLVPWIRDYTAGLAAALQLPYTFWDETFTTKQASASMRARGTKARDQRGWVDAVAAAIILQDYLDARRGGLAPPPAADLTR